MNAQCGFETGLVSTATLTLGGITKPDTELSLILEAMFKVVQTVKRVITVRHCKIYRVSCNVDTLCLRHTNTLTLSV